MPSTRNPVAGGRVDLNEEPNTQISRYDVFRPHRPTANAKKRSYFRVATRALLKGQNSLIEIVRIGHVLWRF